MTTPQAFLDALVSSRRAQELADCAASASPADLASATRYKTVGVGGLKIFYREAGPQDAPVLLLLHGYPSSSRMFEPLLPLLARDFRLIAPDYPGFGHSDAPDRTVWQYTFDRLAQTIVDFTDALGLMRYGMYLQDYGGPIGFRMALARPERVQALIVQNAVLHEEGLTAVWNLRRAYWAQRAQNEPKIREGMYSVQAGVARHVGGRANPDRFNPDLWMDELAFLKRPGMDAIQLDLVYDYQSNLQAYPKWQAYLRDRRPPTLVVWGIHDPVFSVDGVQAIARELPDAEVRLLEAGHFAINDQPDAIAGYIRTFLRRATL
jgi:pimeloyl-ACP methyl ester carboxylesterase